MLLYIYFNLDEVEYDTQLNSRENIDQSNDIVGGEDFVANCDADDFDAIETMRSLKLNLLDNAVILLFTLGCN
jgi:hypothetical protein